MNKIKGIRIIGISWDIDDEDMDEDGVLLDGENLPDSLEIEDAQSVFGKDCTKDDLLDYAIADYLSNTYGYCVYGIDNVEFF